MKLQMSINSLKTARGLVGDSELYFEQGAHEEFAMNTDQKELVVDWLQALKLQMKNLIDYMESLNREV